MTRDEIIQQNPLYQYLRSLSVPLRGSGYALTSRQCPVSTHRQDHFCVTVDTVKNLWHCNDCNIGGTVIDWVMHAQKLSVKDAMERLGGKIERREPVEVDWYDYKDENGNLLYQVVRYLPKTFRQRHKVDDKWVWTMDGVRRVLYHLPEIIAAPIVIVCEGEKDCNTLVKLGHEATCNVGGAKKWLDSYSDTLKGKIVYVWPDTDKPGQEHKDLVVKSLIGKAKEIFVVTVEDKDASDFVSKDPLTARERVMDALKAAKKVNTEDEIPIKSFTDIELDYQEHVKKATGTCLDLSKWLPSLRCVRPLVPGELMSVLANTGVGKTAILQNIALKAEPMPTLIFELELPTSLMFERFCQIDQGFSGEDIFNNYRDNTPLAWKPPHVAHLFFYTKGKLTPSEMERVIDRAELKMGKRPALVMVDYIGLMTSGGGSRYERISEVAESLKTIAKSTDTIIVFASQIARKGQDDGQEIGLHDGKDSGSVENSSGLVLGAWREGEMGEQMILKILKNTKGHAGGRKIACNFNGSTLKITERAKIDDSDIPPIRPYKD